MDLSQVSLSISRMKSNPKAALVGAAIRNARKSRKKVMREVAEHLGIDVAAVNNWELGRNLPSTDNLLRVAEYLGVNAAALGRGDVEFLNSAASVNEVEIVTDPAPPQLGPMDVKLLGGVAAGDDADFSLNGEINGYVRRPPGIAHLNNVFATHVLTESMIPRYDVGELLYCGGRAPVPGDHVVIEMFPDDGETITKAYVKKLIRRTKAEYICEQYNPVGEKRFDAYRVKNIWRIIPTRELYGF